MDQIIVTGCAGFVGSHVTEKLLLLGYQVLGVDNFDPFYSKDIKLKNLENAFRFNSFSFYEADILDKKGIEKIFKASDAKSLIHLAALAGVSQSFIYPDRYFEVNVIGTKNIFETALQHHINHFIYASSSSVYGELNGHKAVEDTTPLQPLSPYGLSKMESENYIKELHHQYGFDVNILRFFSVYGSRQRPDMAFQKFRKQMLNGETIELYGENISRDFTEVNKVVNSIISALDYKNKCEIFNVANGNPCLVKDMILQIGKELGITPKIKVVGQQKGDPYCTHADITKLEKLVGESSNYLQQSYNYR